MVNAGDRGAPCWLSLCCDSAGSSLAQEPITCKSALVPRIWRT